MGTAISIQRSAVAERSSPGTSLARSGADGGLRVQVVIHHRRRQRTVSALPADEGDISTLASLATDEGVRGYIIHDVLPA
jgi:hypothetical protein